MANQKKIDIVENLVNKITKSKSLIFSDYRGLKVNQIQELKRKVKKEKGEYLVAKNTLILKALSKAGFPVPDISQIEGPSALLLSYEDETKPLITLVSFAKTGALPTLKLGILDNTLLSKDEVIILSKLPNKNVLYGNLTNILSSPLSGFISVLKGNTNKLVYLLNAVKNIKN